MRALGIVLAGGNSRRMGALSYKRAISAMPIAGSYRSIDFVLSKFPYTESGGDYAVQFAQPSRAFKFVKVVGFRTKAGRALHLHADRDAGQQQLVPGHGGQYLSKSFVFEKKP